MNKALTTLKNKKSANTLQKKLAEVYDFHFEGEFAEVYNLAKTKKDFKALKDLLTLIAPYLYQKQKPIDSDDGLKNSNVVLNINPGTVQAQLPTLADSSKEPIIEINGIGDK